MNHAVLNSHSKGIGENIWCRLSKNAEEDEMKKNSHSYVRKLPGLIALLLFVFLSRAYAEEIKKLSLDDMASLGTSISVDSKVKVEGNASARISTLWPTTICLGEVSRLNVDNGKLVYEAKVRSEGLEGTAFLEMWCHIGGGQYFSRGMNSVITGTTDWKKLETPFILQPGQKAEKVTLNIVVNGKGKLWIDDIRLLKEPLK
jgi:hypothetical protein